jgi:hypothetical protein
VLKLKCGLFPVVFVNRTPYLCTITNLKLNKMNDKTFVLNNLLYGFIDLLDAYQDKMSETTQSDYTALCKASETLDEDHPNIDADVKYYLNRAIDIATGIEDEMSEDDKADIEQKHLTIKNLDALDELHQGQLVIHEGKPYQIYEIDLEDLTVCIGDKEEENGFWVDASEVKTEC